MRLVFSCKMNGVRTGSCWSASVGVLGIEKTCRINHVMYREVQMDFTPEMKLFYMLFERCFTKNRKRDLKQHVKYFNFRSITQFDHPVVFHQRQPTWSNPKPEVVGKIWRLAHDVAELLLVDGPRPIQVSLGQNLIGNIGKNLSRWSIQHHCYRISLYSLFSEVSFSGVCCKK